MKNSLLCSFLFMCMSGIPAQTLTRSVDYNQDVELVQQEYSFWCVYACIEAVNETDQEWNCGKYIGD